MKKGLKLLTCGVICMSTFAWKVNAEEVNVSDLASLKTCVATPDNVCKVSETISITDSAEETITLNESTITSATDTISELFYVNNGTLKVTGKGTITAPNDVFSLLGNNVLGGDAIKAELEIGSNIEVVSDTSNCVYLKGKGAKVDVYGSLESKSTKYAVIQGNGTVDTINNIDNGNTVINIYDGASVINENNFGIYHPQSGTLTVTGGMIKGTTGIEMRAGNLVVTGGTIEGTYVPTEIGSNGNGATTKGAGIAIAQHTTEQGINVTISGGIIKGYTALNESNPEENDTESINKVSIEITGGTFTAINEGTNAIYSENVTNFITAGEFNTDVTKYLASITNLTETEDGYKAETVYEVTKGEDQKVTVEEGTEITITIDADYELFDELYLNGKLVDKKYYTVKSGSTIITLSSEYTQTLAAGEYEVTATFTNGGTATTDLTVVANTTTSTTTNPDTSDNMLTYLIVTIISVIGLMLTSLRITKKSN